MTGNTLKVSPMLESNERITYFVYVVAEGYVSEFRTPQLSYQLAGTTNLEHAIYDAFRYANFHGLSEAEVATAFLDAVGDLLDVEYLQSSLLSYQDTFGDLYEFKTTGVRNEERKIS